MGHPVERGGAMTLCEAYEILRVQGGQWDQRADTAAELVLRYLRSVHLDASPDLKEDIVSQVVLTLLRRAHAGKSPSLLEEAAVKGYLRTMMVNGLISWIRKARPGRHNSIEEGEARGVEVEDPGDDPHETAVSRELEALFLEARARLAGPIVEGVAAGMKGDPAANFRRVVSEMLRISEGELTLTALVEQDCAGAVDPEECVRRAQERRYQEQGRAKRRLEGAVDSLEPGVSGPRGWRPSGRRFGTCRRAGASGRR